MSEVDRSAWRFCNSVGIITVTAGGRMNAMAAEWFTPVSINPPLLGVFVGLDRYTHHLMEETPYWAVSLLGERQTDISVYTGRFSGYEVDKLDTFPIPLTAAKHIPAPLIQGAAAHFECRTVAKHLYGDHTLYVGHPIRAAADPDAPLPLVYYKGGMYHLGEREPRLERDQAREMFIGGQANE
ncbi:MAG: flavin reductase family protein [Thermaerobacterales bacterium]